MSYAGPINETTIGKVRAATDAATPSTVVERDEDGNFSGEVISASTQVLTDHSAETVPNPPAGAHSVVNRNGSLYLRDPSGTEVAVGGGGGGAGTVISPGGTISGTYTGEVVSTGDINVTGNTTIYGNVSVGGNFINTGGYILTVYGDVLVNGYMNFSPSSTAIATVDVLIQGDLEVRGLITQSFVWKTKANASTSGSTVLVLSSFPRASILSFVSVEVKDGAAAGFTSNINSRSTFNLNLATALPANVANGDEIWVTTTRKTGILWEPTSAAVSFQVDGDLRCAWFEAIPQFGVSSNNVEIKIGGSCYTPPATASLAAIDGSTDLGSAANLTVRGTLYNYHVYMFGNDSNVPSYGGANGGTVTIGSATGGFDIRVNGSTIGTAAGISTGIGGGTGGNIFIRDACNVGNLRTAGGGSSYGNGGNAGSITAYGHVTFMGASGITANGGPASSTTAAFTGGSGATISLYAGASAPFGTSLDAGGGQSTSGGTTTVKTGGTGGSFTFAGVSTGLTITAKGGSGILGAHSGNGGAVGTSQASFINCNIDVSGGLLLSVGDSSMRPNTGNGGAISGKLYSNAGGTISSKGGQFSAFSAGTQCGNGGNGGTVTFDSLVASTINLWGADGCSTNTTSISNGGHGGAFTTYGPTKVATLSVIAGLPYGTGAPQAGAGSVTINGGGEIGQLSATDAGSGAAASTTTFVKVAGSTVINQLIVGSRTSIKNITNTAATLKIGSAGFVRFVNEANSQSADDSANIATRIYHYAYSADHWYYSAGTLLI